MICPVSRDVFEILERKRGCIGAEEEEEEGKRQRAEVLGWAYGEEAASENEESCKGRKQGGEYGDALQAERWSRVDPGDGLIGEEEQERRETDDACEKERGYEEDDAVGAEEYRVDTPDNERPIRVCFGIDPHVVEVVCDDGSEPGEYRGSCQKEQCEDVENIPEKHRAFQEPGKSGAEEDQAAVGDDLGKAGIPEECEKVRALLAPEESGTEDDGEPSVEKAHFDMKDGTEIVDLFGKNGFGREEKTGHIRMRDGEKILLERQDSKCEPGRHGTENEEQ